MSLKDCRDVLELLDRMTDADRGKLNQLVQCERNQALENAPLFNWRRLKRLSPAMAMPSAPNLRKYVARSGATLFRVFKRTWWLGCIAAWGFLFTVVPPVIQSAMLVFTLILGGAIGLLTAGVLIVLAAVAYDGISAWADEEYKLTADSAPWAFKTRDWLRRNFPLE